MRRRDWRIEQIAAVEREYAVISVASELLLRQLQVDPSSLGRYKLERADYVRAGENLSATYLIRLFAEFESGLREAWKRCFKKKSHPKTVDLLASFAAKRAIPEDVYAHAEGVRKYRNSLVHEDDTSVESVTVRSAKSYLCAFFSRLPPNW